MKKILDYEEMQELLNSLKGINKCEPIGYTNFGYPIDHYTYGNGDNHIIITGGTHGSELISNIFVIRFMEKLSKGEISIDKETYTIHFIPFVNPEGTIIVTSAIRSLIPRDMPEDQVQTYCLAYYRNSFIEGEYALKYNDKENKLQHWMFRHATPDLLEGKLKESINNLIEEYNLPKGCMINWSSNGRGVDLNSNIEHSSYIDRIKKGEKIYADLHLNTIRRDKKGPVGCPFYDEKEEIEPENIALLKLYQDIKDNHNLIGSFIYHSCGNIIYYLNKAKEKNPWKELTEEDYKNNLEIAQKYAQTSNYKLAQRDYYTTMDAKLKTFYPYTLLVELGSVRAHPLSQFMDLDIEGSGEGFKHVYTKIIDDNTRAILETIPLMLEISNKTLKK